MSAISSFVRPGMTEESRTKIVAMLADHVRIITVATAAASLVLSGAWWAFGPRIEEFLRDTVGITEVKGMIVEQGTRIEDTQRAVEGLTERITAMEPAPSVAEYDIRRSDIDDVCYIGGTCNYEYRVRRTEEGASCGAPTAQRPLVDNSGITYFVDAAGRDLVPQRLDDNWTIVAGSFVIPSRVIPGIAEFSLQLTYPDCDRDVLGRVVVVEESPHLIFEIRRAENP